MIETFKDIAGSEKWASIIEVKKGWSEDKKYHIVTDEGLHLLLRVSSIEKLDSKQREFDVIKALSELGFDMSTPYEIGVCSEGVYMLLRWIEGDDLEEAVKKLPLKRQYALGYEAGQILKKIHSVKIDFEPFSWAERFGKKMDRNITRYEACPIQYPKGHLFIGCINASRHLLDQRPTVFQHGDYHIGNMVLTQEGKVGIIDFSRYDFGDPYEEFNRIVWDVENSPAFASGKVDGYFDGLVPEDFFKLLAMYIASNTLSALPWSIPYGEQDVLTMLEQGENTLKMYDDFNQIVPIWYKNWGQA